MAIISNKQPGETLFPNIESLCDWVGEIPTYPRRRDKKTINYYNVPCAFDIEFTSAYIGEGKQKTKAGIMYLWSFCINGGVIQGRTWQEWIATTEYLTSRYGLSKETRLIIFCRNLETEFQFMRCWFEWSNVFAVNLRRPVYALTTTGIEFRCSYILSGESLETSGKKLQTYPIQKLVGDLDYSLYRHSQTPVTDRERDYAINDVRVDVAYIQERMNDVQGMITRLQLTKTGYVRKFLRDKCFYTGSHKKNGWKMLNYKARMQSLQMTPAEYLMLRRAFQGGFTHTSARYSGTVQYDVDSWDLTSSYPCVMVAYRFPMSSGELYKISTIEDFRKQLRLYCCVFDIEFTGLCIKDKAPDCPISRSKCWRVKGDILENNGRVARCDGSFCTTITNVDFQVYEQYYTWEKMRIGTFYRYRKGYLPTEIIEGIIELYEKKTTLKNVFGREQEYSQAKENINSVYGCTVTDVCRDSNIYDGETWEVQPADVDAEIEKYNKNPRRFLFYPWGVFVTAYARMRLFKAIWCVGEDGYYYSDTDSVKILHGERYRAFFERENEDITKKIEKALTFHKIDPARAKPKTIKGVEKPLGVWDYEGQYKRFKALRAKAYMVETDDGINITVSGVNKKRAVPYICTGWAQDVKTHNQIHDPFTLFDDNMTVPGDYTGKLTHIYIDETIIGTLTDYLGNTATFEERSGIHMEKAEYNMSLSLQYVEYLLGYRERIK